MRAILSVLLAGVIAASATLPAQAGMRLGDPAATVLAANEIQQIGDRHGWRYNDGYSHWRPRHHRRHYRHDYFPRHGGFFFQFPFPRTYGYYHRPRCRDLVLGYDGRWHCYRGW
jgi:hypothetical protein